MENLRAFIRPMAAMATSNCIRGTNRVTEGAPSPVNNLGAVVGIECGIYGVKWPVSEVPPNPAIKAGIGYLSIQSTHSTWHRTHM